MATQVSSRFFQRAGRLSPGPGPAARSPMRKAARLTGRRSMRIPRCAATPGQIQNEPNSVPRVITVTKAASGATMVTMAMLT